MSINAILASKMYRASPRKDKIRAALESPINTELVQQLSEYLDDSAKALNRGAIAQEGENVIGDDVDDIRPGAAGGGGPGPSGGGSFAGGPGGDIDDEFEGEFDENGDPIEVPEGEEPLDNSESTSDDEPPADDEPQEIDSSTSTDGNPISASYDPNQLPTQLKSTLNMREECAGVERVSIKECELWIYYNDKINLNNVMSEVIEILNAANYSYLNFNRLARTDNAIVFDIDLIDSENEVKPIEQDEGDDKK
jgi:hypothetical protein